MSKVTYEICDRCGTRIRTNHPIVRINKLNVVMIFGYGPHGAESNYVLCDECTRLFINFIRPGRIGE